MSKSRILAETIPHQQAKLNRPEENHERRREPLRANEAINKDSRPPLFDHIDLRYLICSMEHTFTCPSCGEEISMVLDLSVSRYTYIEDCEVCCNPIEVSYTVHDDTLARFEARTLE